LGTEERERERERRERNKTVEVGESFSASKQETKVQQRETLGGGS